LKIKLLDAPLASAGSLAEKRQVLVTISTPDVDRQGDIVDQNGIDYSNFRRSPTILYNHDPDQPIARAIDIGLIGGKLRSLAQFPPPGTSARSDEVYSLIVAGVICSASIGFRPIKSEPLNPKDPWAGRRYTAVELCEFSFVSVPANANATVLAKGWKSGRVLSSENAELVAKIGQSLRRSELAHARATAALDEANTHRRQAIQHTKRLAAAANLDGEPEGADDGADSELSLESQRRKRIIQIARHGAA
jgi:HK97 family phage prohead protease